MDAQEIHTDQIWARLQHSPLDLEAADAFLRGPSTGGVSLFAGTTRRWTEGRETVRLEFEAYQPMALTQMERLMTEARREWPDLRRACVVHRLGTVPPTEASVLCGAAAPHRAAAFGACRFLIDRLKMDVPIWKREVYADGEAEWKSGAASGTQASRTGTSS
ncbi:MAG: molybdenum cofactor biosynthesis protein MoaE [Salinibacter sp.]|uniref:molybdenum cofactor biosynthesis protein MoaE n=1 Tax=Salinibacter sp. TaxID=2065818 RepID=UPI0035D44AC0